MRDFAPQEDGSWTRLSMHDDAILFQRVSASVCPKGGDAAQAYFRNSVETDDIITFMLEIMELTSAVSMVADDASDVQFWTREFGNTGRMATPVGLDCCKLGAN